VKPIPKTTLEYWALIAEIAGAIAVVMSVIYLGVHVRANTKVLRSQAHFNALSLAQRPFEMVIDNEGLSKILNVGFATPEKLSPEGWIRCSYYCLCSSTPGNICRIATNRFRKSSGLAPTNRSSSSLRRSPDTAVSGRNGKTRSTNRFAPTSRMSLQRRIRRNDPASPRACLTIGYGKQ
jgi:hypothetical protein